MAQSHSRLLDILRAVDLSVGTDAALNGRAMLIPIPGGTCRIEAAEMADMLKAAGAPEPWLRPNKCIAVVGHPVSEGQQKIEHRAQNAVNELRRVLPQVIENEERGIGKDLASLVALKESQPESLFVNLAVLEISEELGQRLDNIEKLKALSAAVEAAPTMIRRGIKDWHPAAVWLASYYRGVVGTFKISADGPAVRFIAAVMRRLGWHEMVTPAAIAKAVRGTEKNPPAEKILGTSGYSSQ